MEELKQNGIWIYGTDAAGTDYTQTDFRDGTAFVIGSEGNGMGRLVREHCDQLLSLPMYGKVNSLNASVAASIFMYECGSGGIHPENHKLQNLPFCNPLL